MLECQRMPEITDMFTPALVIALFAWLRTDIRKLQDRVESNATDLNGWLDTMATSFNERLDVMATSFNERLDASNRDIHGRIDNRFDAVLHEIAELRERMAKMEGSLEGFLAGRRDGDAA